jgi:hypothetical protein
MIKYLKKLITLFAMLLITVTAYAMHTSTLSHSSSITTNHQAAMRENATAFSAEKSAYTSDYSATRSMSAESGIDEISMQDTIQTSLAAE